MTILNLTNLNEEKFWLASQCLTPVAFEGCNQSVYLYYGVCAINNAFISVAQQGRNKAVGITVIFMSS